MLRALIAGFSVIVIGFMLIPTIANEVGIIGNVTGVASPIPGLITLFFALGITAAAIAIAASGLKAAGLIGDEDDETEEDEAPQEAHEPRNYWEYVVERLKVEKLLRRK